MNRFEQPKRRRQPRIIVKPPAEYGREGPPFPTVLLAIIVVSLLACSLLGCASLTPDQVSLGYARGSMDGDTRLASDLGIVDSDAFGLESDFDVTVVMFLLTWDLQERASESQVRRLRDQLTRLTALLRERLPPLR